MHVRVETPFEGGAFNVFAPYPGHEGHRDGWSRRDRAFPIGPLDGISEQVPLPFARIRRMGVAK